MASERSSYRRVAKDSHTARMRTNHEVTPSKQRKGTTNAAREYWNLKMEMKLNIFTEKYHMPSRPFGIVFDCDGVLVDSEVISMSVDQEHLSNLGLHYDPKDYKALFAGLSRKDCLSTMKKDYEAMGKGDFPQNFEETVCKVRWQRYEKELKAMTGVTEFLESFDAPVAAASSSSRWSVCRKLQLTRLEKYFYPYIYSGDQVARGKPLPDLFLLATQGIHVATENCIVLEDSINGVIAGTKAGCIVWGFTGGSHADCDLSNRLVEAGACEVFSNYQEMIKVVAKLAKI